MTGSGDDDGSVDGVGVHTRLVVVVHGDESPVGDNTGNADTTVGVLASDQVLDGGGVELKVESVYSCVTSEFKRLTSFTFGN